MKQAHRPDLWVWSRFDEARNLDFHALAWIRPAGNVLIDPLPMSDHDLEQLRLLGGAAHVVITNSDHTRDARALAQRFGAELCGPRAEREAFPFPCARWLGDGEEVVAGLRVVELAGSKTPGELALVLENTTLISGDLVRGHLAGKLNLLPAAKLSDRAQAVASLSRIVREFPELESVLVGDGWPVFRDGLARLRELASSS